MKALDRYNPIVVFSYFLAVTLPAMFSMQPFLLLLSLFGACLYFFVKNGTKNGRLHLVFFGLLCLISLVNPLFQHNGVTVLFILNSNPVTLEAFLYGLFAGVMTVSVLYWFSLMSSMMTSDKYLYIFGKISPKIALLLSMAMRFVPLFSRRINKVRGAQKGLGLYRDDTLFDKIRGEIRIFSIMVTWCLEDGIHTASSMEARGYNTGRRSQFALFHMTASDLAMLLFMLVLAGVTLLSLSLGALDFDFYPALTFPVRSPLGALGLGAYGTLSLLPTILEAKEALKWHWLRSKI